MNASKVDTSTARPIEIKTQLVLGTIKGAILRIDEIRQELINAGVALKAGYITPQAALDWAEEHAPGCVGYIPPLTGLGINRDGGVK
ncbi:hypothetical protein [Bradyrhizobium sp. USDA 3256]